LSRPIILINQIPGIGIGGSIVTAGFVVYQQDYQ